MSSVDPRVLEMRRAFDGTFAEPPPPAGQAGEALLALQIAGDPYAVRMAQLGGLVHSSAAVIPPSANLPPKVPGHDRPGRACPERVGSDAHCLPGPRGRTRQRRRSPARSSR